MLNLAIAADIFNPRIRNAAVVLKKRRQPARGDVTGFVDRRGQHRAAMLTIPHRVVGPAAKKRYPKWSARNDHGVSRKGRSANPASEIQASELYAWMRMETKGLITNVHLT